MARTDLRKLEAVPGTVFSYKGNKYVAEEDPILNLPVIDALLKK